MCQQTAGRQMCAAPWCTRDVAQAVTAAGTRHALKVCDLDHTWAKDEIAEDFPGRAAIRTPIGDDTDIDWT